MQNGKLQQIADNIFYEFKKVAVFKHYISGKKFMFTVKVTLRPDQNFTDVRDYAYDHGFADGCWEGYGEDECHYPAGAYEYFEFGPSFEKDTKCGESSTKYHSSTRCENNGW